MAGNNCLQQGQSDKARDLYLRSYRLWSKAKHINGTGISLIFLAEVLEFNGSYADACCLLYRARELLFDRSIWTITARDTRNRIAYDHKLSLETLKTDEPTEELVTALFGK